MPGGAVMDRASTGGAAVKNKEGGAGEGGPAHTNQRGWGVHDGWSNSGWVASRRGATQARVRCACNARGDGQRDAPRVARRLGGWHEAGVEGARRRVLRRRR